MKRAYLATVLDLSLPLQDASPAAQELARGIVEAMQVLRELPAQRLEVALSGATTATLLRYGEERALQMLAERASAGQVTFLSTACYGAFLPLLPVEEARRQIDLNDEANREALGDVVYRAEGLFPPQLGYSRSVAELAGERGLPRILIDELGYRGGRVRLPRDRHFVFHGHTGFHPFFVDRELSERVALAGIHSVEQLHSLIATHRSPGYAVIRLPGRLLLPGRPGLGLLASLDGNRPVVPASLEEILALFGEVESVEPLPCALGTDPGELAAGIQFAKWSAPDNELHALLWRLANVAFAEARRLAGDPSEAAGRLRAMLDESLDCAAWRYASGKPEFDPEKVRAGGLRIAAAVRAGRPAVRAEALAEAERLLVTLDARCAELARAASPSLAPA